MKAHLVDGTYELFRHYYGIPEDERSGTGAVRGVLGTVLNLIEGGATHVGVATDHVIESFRNHLWPGYKSSAGMDQELLSVFPLLEECLQAMGVLVWPMVEVEADDALGSAAAVLADDETVEQVIICTPDKDLGQCVVGQRVVQLDRRKDVVTDEQGVWAKFGVGPASVPDWLALTGDSADGFPGLKGWGAKSASAVLAHYGHLENIPENPAMWEVPVRGAAGLAATLNDNRDLAELFRVIATIRIDRDLLRSPDELRWAGPTDDFAGVAAGLGGAGIAERAAALARRG